MTYNDYFIDLVQTSSVEEKIAMIKANNNRYLSLQKEMNENRKKKIVISRSVESPTKEIQDLPNIPVQDANTEENQTKDIDNLYSAISLLDIENKSEEEIINKMNSILNTIKPNESSISKLKLLLYKEYMLYCKILFELTDKDEISDIEEQMKSIIIKINLLDELLEEDDLTIKELVENTTEDNNLFFLITDKGNIPAYENLRKSVPSEHYQAFKELLLSIKSGTFKGIKRLSRYHYYELKKFGVRITFDKLSNGNYLIIDAFMKKYNSSEYYRKRLEIRTSQYFLLREYYLSHIEDEDFKSKHEKYLEEFLNLLDNETLKEDFSHERRLI